MRYDKLVRDKIPDIIKGKGFQPVTQVMDAEVFSKYLDAKLMEELKEYQESKSIEELADLIEVVYAIVKSKGLSVSEFENIRLKKAEERGAFEGKVLLKEVLGE